MSPADLGTRRSSATTASTLQPRRHAPPEGWQPEVFAAVTDALAAALVSAYRREERLG